jgi:hypothetical protein
MTGSRGAVIGGTMLATLPLWTLVVMIAGKPGFGAYLIISDRYYHGARLIFGAGLFPRAEFGTIPKDAPAMLVAAFLYAAVGSLLGYVIGRALSTGIDR